MRYFNLKYKIIKINILKYAADKPFNLVLICVSWSVIAKDQFSKFELLMVHYGKVDALFHTTTLGPALSIFLHLIARNNILLRYFIEILLIYLRKYDRTLV